MQTNIGFICSYLYCLVIVIVEADKLTRDAQHALRRTMEKYISSCRLILCCNSTSRVIPAVRSRCLAIRVAAPTIDEVGRLNLDTYLVPETFIYIDK